MLRRRPAVVTWPLLLALVAMAVWAGRGAL